MYLGVLLESPQGSHLRLQWGHARALFSRALGTPHPDLKDIGLHNPDLILCVDGSHTENKQ